VALGREGRVLMTGIMTAPKRMAAWRTGVGNWTNHTFADEFTACGILQPRAITSTLWFILGFHNYSTANDTDNRIMRTQNGGANWAAFTQPKAGNDYWVDFKADAGGRLWGLTLDETTIAYGIAKAWYSDDEGDNWTLSNTWTGTNATNDDKILYRLACHPTNQNIIAIAGVANYASWHGATVTVYTLDRGASWETPNIDTVANYYHTMFVQNDMMFAASGRLIFVGPGWINVLTSDNYGQIWTSRATFGTYILNRVLGPVGTALGSRIYILHVTWDTGCPSAVWYSDDEGQTWTQFDNNVGNADKLCKGGIAFAEAENAVYVGSDDNLTTNTWLVSKMAPPEKTGAWTDFSDSLVPIGAETHYHHGDIAQQIAAIP